MGPKGKRTWKNNNEAVSEVVGSALLVGLTVAVVSAFGLVATQAFSPTEKVNAELSPLLSRGNDACVPPATPPCAYWNTGNERLELTHLGGANLLRDQTRITITRGSTVTTFSGAGLGPTFDNGGLVIGETWTYTSTIALCEKVEVSVVIQHGRGGSQLLLQETFVAKTTEVCP